MNTTVMCEPQVQRALQQPSEEHVLWGGQDDDVRNYQNSKGPNGQHPAGGGDCNNQQACAGAGQLQQGEHVTEMVVF